MYVYIYVMYIYIYIHCIYIYIYTYIYIYIFICMYICNKNIVISQILHNTLPQCVSTIVDTSS